VVNAQILIKLMGLASVAPGLIIQVVKKTGPPNIMTNEVNSAKFIATVVKK
jgi:hypothetical protein